MTREAAAEPASLPVGNPSRMTFLDVATASMMGCDPERRPPSAWRPASLEGLLEDLLLPALAEGRCFVSFSAGRDSSWVLAAATRAARRHGHPDPVPVTLRYLRAPSARETQAQERVVAHLRLQDWERRDVDDELEVTGPYSQRALETAGVLFPANAYLLLPQLEVAAGGSLVAGFGLSDFFLYWHWARLWDFVLAHRLPRKRDLRYLAAAALPWPLRAQLVGRRLRRPPMPWLRADAAAEAERRFLEESLAVPVRFSAAIRRQHTHRCLSGTRRALAALGESAGVRVLMPLHDEAYVGALAGRGRWWGGGGRRRSMQVLVGDLLPDGMLRQGGGPSLHDVLVGERTRAFVESWSGGGLDPDIVDADALRAQWSRDVLDWRSSLLLQLAYAHDAGVGKKSEVPSRDEKLMG